MARIASRRWPALSRACECNATCRRQPKNAAEPIVRGRRNRFMVGPRFLFRHRRPICTPLRRVTHVCESRCGCVSFFNVVSAPVSHLGPRVRSRFGEHLPPPGIPAYSSHLATNMTPMVGGRDRGRPLALTSSSTRSSSMSYQISSETELTIILTSMVPSS